MLQKPVLFSSMFFFFFADLILKTYSIVNKCKLQRPAVCWSRFTL